MEERARHFRVFQGAGSSSPDKEPAPEGGAVPEGEPAIQGEAHGRGRPHDGGSYTEGNVELREPSSTRGANRVS